MQTARRLYIYLLTGISLGVLVAGLSMLLTVLLERIGLGPSGAQVSGGDVIGQQLTLASALVVVSLPTWLIHWSAAERSVRPDRPAAPVERTTEIRGLFFAVALGALLLAAGLGLASVLETIIVRLAGADEFGSRSIGGGLALAVVAGAAWLYHLAIRTRDWARGPMTGPGAWLPRTYMYVAAFIGLMFLLTGIGGLIEVVGRVVLDEPPLFNEPGDSAWWAFPLGSAVAGILVGGGAWVGHLVYANRLVRDPGWRGASERPARLRLGYFAAVLIAASAGTIFLLADSVGGMLAVLLGVSDGEDAPEIMGLILLPLLSAVPYAIAWWQHGRWMEAEAVASGSDERVETEDRLEHYPVVLVGLAFSATAVAWIIGVLIDAAFGGGRVFSGGDVWRRELAEWVPLALIGISVWIWRWRRIGDRWTVDPVGEAASTTRRAMLLIALAASVLAGIAAAGFIFYRLFGSLFGIGQSGDPVSELSMPLGVLLVAVVVAAYHGIQLRRDQSLRPDVVPSAGEPTAVAPRVELRLSGPPGADPSGVVAALRLQLPPGYVLEAIEENMAP
jgi:hypothetical protein